MFQIDLKYLINLNIPRNQIDPNNLIDQPHLLLNILKNQYYPILRIHLKNLIDQKKHQRNLKHLTLQINQMNLIALNNLIDQPHLFLICPKYLPYQILLYNQRLQTNQTKFPKTLIFRMFQNNQTVLPHLFRNTLKIQLILKILNHRYSQIHLNNQIVLRKRPKNQKFQIDLMSLKDLTVLKNHRSLPSQIDLNIQKHPEIQLVLMFLIFLMLPNNLIYPISQTIPNKSLRSQTFLNNLNIQTIPNKSQRTPMFR